MVTGDKKVFCTRFFLLIQIVMAIPLIETVNRLEQDNPVKSCATFQTLVDQRDNHDNALPVSYSYSLYISGFRLSVC